MSKSVPTPTQLERYVRSLSEATAGEKIRCEMVVRANPVQCDKRYSIVGVYTPDLCVLPVKFFRNIFLYLHRALVWESRERCLNERMIIAAPPHVVITLSTANSNGVATEETGASR